MPIRKCKRLNKEQIKENERQLRSFCNGAFNRGATYTGQGFVVDTIDGKKFSGYRTPIRKSNHDT